MRRESYLSLPGNMADRLRQPFQSVTDDLRHPRREPVRPSRRDQAGPCQRIAGPTPDRGATGRRVEPEKRHQLARVLEPAEAADLGNDHRRHDQRHAAQNRLDDRCQRPLRQQFGDRLLEPIARRLGALDPLQHLLVRQVLGRMREGQFAQPAPMHLRPVAVRRTRAMAQQEAQQLLARLAQIPHRLRPQPPQVPHRLVCFVRHPERQLPGAQRLRQHHRVAPVGLHLVADLAREQRRRHHVAAVPEAGQLTLHVAAGAGFVAKAVHPSTASCTGCAAYPACSQSCRTSAFATASTSATEIVFLCTSKPTKRVRSVMVRLVRCLGIGPDHRSNPRQRCYTP